MPKTATIKLRLTAEEKTNWEAQATADGVSLSSLIRHRMNHPTTRADGGLVPAPKATYGPEDMTPEELAAADAIIDAIEARNDAIIDAIEARKAATPPNRTLKQQLALSPTTPTPFFGGGGLGGVHLGPQGLPTTGPGVVASTDSPRRTTQCEHGRPHYVFCPTCDQ